MPYRLSHSTLNIFKDCPKCFWLLLNKGIKRPDTIFPTLPAGMDRILKHHFDSFREKDALPPELESLNGDVKLFDGLKLLEIWRDARKGGIQWKDDDGNIIIGAVDDILQKGKKLIVLDFKTRGYPVKEDTHEYYIDQLNVYSFLLRKNGYETEDYAYLIFYHPTKVAETGDVLFHKELKKIPISIKAAEKLIKDALKMLEDEMPNASEKCGFCGWREKLKD